MKKVSIALITFYQKVFSLDQGFIPQILGRNRKVCIFYPTCSEYTKQAIEKYGVVKGIRLGTKRILRCNPRGTPGVDLVP